MRAKPVKVLLINIFAGLNRCDLLARGIRRYIEERRPDVPMVVRMMGNREEAGYAILKDIGIAAFSSLEEAVSKAVELGGRA
jgi:succinyl-CoA synthetase beta subunit